MDERKELILNAVIKEYIKTGTPVGSSVLVEKYNIKYSPATVRNEMAWLENEELIVQPHTSAGRVPTEKAFVYYLEQIKPKEIDKDKKGVIDKELSDVSDVALKEVAKAISEISGLAVFWAFYRHNCYYTGISNLLKQPEFSRLDIIYNISGIIDQVDDIVNTIFEQTKQGTKVMFGQENPFGPYMGTILGKYKVNEQDGLFGILGPIRQDYEKNIPLVEYVLSKINGLNK